MIHQAGSYQITVYPTALHLLRDDAKRQLNLLDTSFDTLIDSYILAAEAMLFFEARVLAAPTTLKGYLQNFIDQVIYMEPITDVVIKYQDENDVEQTMDEGTDYLLFKNYPTKIEFLESPDLKDDFADPINITLTAGYDTEPNTPENVKQVLRFMVADYFENRQSDVMGSISSLSRATEDQISFISRRVGV